MPSSRPAPRWRRLPTSHPRWPRWRAGLLLLHALVVIVVAFPAPVRKLDAATWEKPTLRAELISWTRRLRGWGLDFTEDELRERVTSVASAWLRGRSAVVAPLKAYLNALGTPQAWYMFTSPDRVPQSFVVSRPSKEGGLERIFAPSGEDLSRNFAPAFSLEHRVSRVLLTTSWSSRPESFPQLCRWFAAELRRQGEPSTVICQLEARPVEHPAHVGEARPTRITRTWVVGADGHESERWSEPRRAKKRRR